MPLRDADALLAPLLPPDATDVCCRFFMLPASRRVFWRRHALRRYQRRAIFTPMTGDFHAFFAFRVPRTFFAARRERGHAQASDGKTFNARRAPMSA